MKRLEMLIGQNDLILFDSFENKRRKEQLDKKPTSIHSINEIIQSLENEPYIYNPLIVSENKGKYELIDGHHRVKALELFFKKYPERKVNIILNVKDGLNLNQKLEVYRMLDRTTNKQTGEDVFEVCDKILPIKQMIKKSFPVKVVDRKIDSAITFSQLFKAWSQRESSKHIIKSKENLLQEVQMYDAKDYQDMVEYFKWMSDLFGYVSFENKYYKLVPLNTIMKLYFRNKVLVSLPDFNKQCKKVLLNNPYFAEHQTGARQIIDYVYARVVEQMNKGWKHMELV
jgi:hypothetical protein